MKGRLFITGDYALHFAALRSIRLVEDYRGTFDSLMLDGVLRVIGSLTGRVPNAHLVRCVMRETTV